MQRGRTRPGPHPTLPPGAAAVLALQRAAGNEAINALMLGRMRMPGATARREMDDAYTELHRDEPVVDKVERGLRAAKALGIPVDLEGIRPPASALAVTTTGFGPGNVAAKKPVLPPKKTPALSPLGQVSAKKAPGARAAGAKAAGPAPVAAPDVGGGVGVAAPVITDPLQAPVAPAFVRPVDDPAFAAVTGKVKATAKQKRSHPPASAKAKEAQDAALPPANDIGTQAKAAKADTMEAQRPGSFDKVAFITAVKAAIEAKTPKTLAQADKYKESGKTAEVKGEVRGMVAEGKQGQARDIVDATAAAPDQSKTLAKPVTPMGPEPPGLLTPVPATGAVPKPAPADQLNLAAGTHQTQDEMTQAEVTEEQLAESNEPQFNEALADKRAVAAHAETAPAAYRADEAQVIDQHKAEAQATTAAGLGGMQSARGGALTSLVADKGKTKTKDEAKRAEVTTTIEAIFNLTEAEVKKTLDGIDPLVEKEFNAGEASARGLFESFVSAKMSAYKKDRYGGWLGKFRWIRDKIKGMPDKVNEFYVAGRELYLKEMEKTISRVAEIVGTGLNTAKARIARGQAEIASYVKSLPKDLRKVGADAGKEIADRFAQLESDVDAKKDALVDDLASRYVAARKGLDERIEALQAENRGLIDKAIGAIKAVINTIRELVSMLTGVLARAAGVIGQIVKHPIRFLENLVAGVKGGIMKFKEDFFGHLKRGLMRWLFGALAESGVELPKSFDLKGIVGFLASIFGLTWSNIRQRLVRQIGEPAMVAVEKGVEIFTLLSGPEGVGGLWQMILDKVGDVKNMIFESVKDFVKDRIITAGVTWLIGLLNPAAAFIKACKMIYDIVIFFVNNAGRIKTFVDTVLDSVSDMVGGNVGAVVNKVNDALGQMVPIIIGFLASLVNLGGIGQKIRELVNRLQKPVTKAVDFLIAKGLQLAGPIIRRVAGVAGKVKAKVAAGKAWVKGKAEAVRDRLTGRATERAGAEAIRQAGVALRAGHSRREVDERLEVLRRQFGVPLTIVVDRQQPGSELVHVQTITTPSYTLPTTEAASDEYSSQDPASVFEVVAESVNEDYLNNFANWRSPRPGQAAGQTRAVPVQLSAHAVRWNHRAVRQFADQSGATAAQRSAAVTFAAARIDAAEASAEETSIYRYLRAAASRIQDLYGGRAIFGLDVEHLDEVAQNKALYPRTRISRVYAGVIQRLRDGHPRSGTPEVQIAATNLPADRCRQIARLYAEQLVEAELGDVGETERRRREPHDIDLLIISTVIHQQVTARRHRERR